MRAQDFRDDMSVIQSITVDSKNIEAGKAALTAYANSMNLYVWDFLINPTINGVTNITADMEIIPPYTRD